MDSKEERIALIDSLKTECNRCGITDKTVLLFHHVNPAEKEKGVGKHMTIEKIKQEAAKCEILCFNCHTEHHRKFPVRGTRKPPGLSSKRYKIGAEIARGERLKDNLMQLFKLDPHLVRDIYDTIYKNIPI